MVFSSITFIYYFLPIMLLAYYITPNKYKNITLVIGSLLFYVYGAGYFVFLLLALCIFNYILGQKISVFKNKQKRKVALVAGLVVNFGLLFYFKYTIDNVYHFGNIRDFYMMDRENLELLIKRINEMNKNKFGKTKIYALDLLTETLNEKLELLKTGD